MARKITERPSGHGQLTKIRLSDGCGEKTNSTAARFKYDRHGCESIWGMSDKWYYLAAAQGGKPSIKKRVKLEGELSPKHVSEGKARAASWTPAGKR